MPTKTIKTTTGLTKKTAKLSKQGQITIPRSAIKQLGLITEQLVDIEIHEDSIVIKKRTSSVKKFIGILKDKTALTSQEYLQIRKKESAIKA